MHRRAQAGDSQSDSSPRPVFAPAALAHLRMLPDGERILIRPLELLAAKVREAFREDEFAVIQGEYSKPVTRGASVAVRVRARSPVGESPR